MAQRGSSQSGSSPMTSRTTCASAPSATPGGGAPLTPARTVAWTAGSIPGGGLCSGTNSMRRTAVPSSTHPPASASRSTSRSSMTICCSLLPPKDSSFWSARHSAPPSACSTRHLTELPPLTTLLPPKHHDKLSEDNILTYCAAWGSGASYDSTVVLCFNGLRMLGMAKPGDDRWTLLEYNGPGAIMTPLMFAGRFYCVNLTGGVMVLEMGADQPPHLKVAANLSMLAWTIAHTMHLVNNCGELMLVHRHVGEQFTSADKPRWWYDTYRVDLDVGTLLPVKSLGSSAGRAVFMGMCCSLSVSLECFPSGSISADTIYLSFDIIERQQHKIGAYRLIDGSVEPISENLLTVYLCHLLSIR